MFVCLFVCLFVLKGCCCCCCGRYCCCFVVVVAIAVAVAFACFVGVVEYEAADVFWLLVSSSGEPTTSTAHFCFLYWLVDWLVSRFVCLFVR